MILFGITMSAFLSAVAMVESDNGLTSDNVYQLEEVYIRDVERISGLRFSVDAKYNRAASETIMCIYLSHYGKVYERKTGNTSSKVRRYSSRKASLEAISAPRRITSLSPHSEPKISVSATREAIRTPHRANCSADAEHQGNGSSNTRSAPARMAHSARTYGSVTASVPR